MCLIYDIASLDILNIFSAKICGQRGFFRFQWSHDHVLSWKPCMLSLFLFFSPWVASLMFYGIDICLCGFLPEASFVLWVLSLSMCVSLSVCVRSSVNYELVRAITHDPFKLVSPNVDQEVQSNVIKIHTHTCIPRPLQGSERFTVLNLGTYTDLGSRRYFEV